MSEMKIGCVVLAAGLGCRFGGNKLNACIDGKTLIFRALEAVPAQEFCQVVVVTGQESIKETAKSFSFTVIDNPHPEWGQSYSLRLGLHALFDCDAVLFQVADQPYLMRSSIAELVAFYKDHPTKIAALSHNGKRGNPCIFPSDFFPELLSLDGDVGGNVVIHHHKDRLILWEVAEKELQDIDTPEQL